jgi:regulator of sigma E protease
MQDFLLWVYVAAAVVLMFGASVFVHELGHFLVARWRGMKVEAFAIGFGPRVWSRKHNGIEYSVRWIPAGGFVKLPQMITSEALEGGKSDTPPPPPASPLSKILVAFAGPLMNVLFAFLVATVVFFTGLPVPVNPAIIGHVDETSAEYAAGVRAGDRIVAINGQPVSSWEEVTERVILSRTNVFAVTVERAGRRETVTLSASLNNALGLKMLNLEPQDHPVVRGVLPGSAAEAVGLKPGDTVVSFAGVPIAGREQFIKLIQQRPGEATELVIQREGKEMRLTITPRLNPATGKGFIGAEIGGSEKVVYQVRRPGPTPWENFREVWQRTIGTLGALLHSKETGVGAKDLSGPVGIFAFLAAQVSIDYRLALNFLVLLNLNLAILNLLPIPVLDGGHILMALVEWVRGRPLSLRVVEYTTTGFALLLISFMLYVTFFDLKRMPLFRMLFSRETQVQQVEPAPVPPAAPAAPAAPAPAPARP